jgi:SAM-dependent methyltransferase
MTIDSQKLDAFMGKVLGDASSAAGAIGVVLGDRLGLYKALRESPATPSELASRSKTHERYVREWLNGQAAGGYVVYDRESGRYSLPPEQAFALAEEGSPAFAPGLFQVMQAMWAALPRVENAFKNGGGIAWGDHHPCLFEGTERFFRPGYAANLVTAWLPALDGVVAKLERGARVVDLGCGLGASTILMAQAYPKSTFIGFDSHVGSIELAKKRAAEAGVSDRVRFEVGSSTNFPGDGYDLVACFDCLHDMEDPIGAAKHVRRALAKDGTFLVVEPFAHDDASANHNPIGRLFYSASTCLCVPHSLSQGGPALGAQAGEARLRDVIVGGGGFRSLKRATETPFNIILEARP